MAYCSPWVFCYPVRVRYATIDFTARTARRSDLHRCVVLDRLSHGTGWNYLQFRKALANNNSILLVATLPAQFEFTEELVGICVANLVRPNHLRFRRLSVHPEWQRCGIGSGLFSLTIQSVPTDLITVECPAESRAHLQFWTGMRFRRVPDRDGPEYYLMERVKAKRE